ncbi:MAG: SufE family protein [Methylobacteriaceae bacterium]|jgi:cysteine desulfuration protein SufE|nr:SufE family protein [Methylobacteriaceae bacterium]
MSALEQILDDFAFLPDWEDRYRYLIELGGGLAPLSAEEHSDANRVMGCASQVWLVVAEENAGGAAHFRFRADSDAHIVRGLLAIVIAMYDGKSAADILAVDSEAVFDTLHLAEHLSRQRSNGLRSVVERIRAEAKRRMG